MNPQDFIFYSVILVAIGLCFWVMILDSKVYDQKRYIEKLERDNE